MKTITFEQDIYTYDIDSSHHVSNISFIKWMEIGRNKLSKEAGLPIENTERLGFAPVLKRTEILYKKSLYLGDKVTVELHLSELRKISGTIKFTFYNQHNDIVAEGFQEALFYSLSTKRPYTLPKEQWALFAEYLEEK